MTKIIVRRGRPKTKKKKIRLLATQRATYDFLKERVGSDGKYRLPNEFMAKHFDIDVSTAAKRIKSLEAVNAVKILESGFDKKTGRQRVTVLKCNPRGEWKLRPTVKKTLEQPVAKVPTEFSPNPEPCAILPTDKVIENTTTSEPVKNQETKSVGTCSSLILNSNTTHEDSPCVYRVGDIGLDINVAKVPTENSTASEPTPPESPLDKARRNLAEYLEADKKSTAEGFPNSWDEPIQKAQREVERLSGVPCV